MAYELRKRSRKPKDYSEYTNKLPRLSRTSGKPRKDNKLYELEVLEEDDLHGRVKVHYLGYDSQHDEWRDRDDIVSLQPRNEVYIPFHLHNELAYQIKMSLNSSSRSGPDVRIEMPFDKILFSGGLQRAGKLARIYRGHTIYKILTYSDLKPLLGAMWHVRFLNKQKDFCYVIQNTVNFYIHQRLHIVDPVEPSCTTDGGFVLIFRFVRGDGVRRHWEEDISKIK